MKRLASLITVVLLSLGALTACSAEEHSGAPEAIETLILGLESGDLAEVALTSNTRGFAQLDFDQIFAGMESVHPQVELQELEITGTNAEATLINIYQLSTPWEFTTQVRLNWEENAWRIHWDPTIVHPELTVTSRLTAERRTPSRANIIGARNTPIVWERPVYRVGIDKTQVSESEQPNSAAELANLIGIDATDFTQQVAAAGSMAFVVAITLREGQVPEQVYEIPGARAIETSLPLADSPTFTNGLLGIVSAATAEDVENGAGAIQPGDLVGQSGLQSIHDEQLRGKAGFTIRLMARTETMLSNLKAVGIELPADTKVSTKELLRTEPVGGVPLTITLDLELQRKAESILADQAGMAALVVLDVNTGAILAAGNSPAVGYNSYATLGQWAPGSTFKITSSLALIRQGMSPDSPINCPANTVIANTQFKNHDLYPAAYTGSIPLRVAVANSCNTAFLLTAADFNSTQQPNAAGSLGLGIDYDAGFPAFYGSVPATDETVTRAANAIGQGKILASPMAMAGEAASVAAGRTIIPHLVDGLVPESKAQELTAGEAAYLQDLMQSVVNSGTAMNMRGYLIGAKTGTAEFGSDGKSHAWMIGYNSQYAIAGFIEDGPTAANIVRAMLS